MTPPHRETRTVRPLAAGMREKVLATARIEDIADDVLRLVLHGVSA